MTKTSVLPALLLLLTSCAPKEVIVPVPEWRFTADEHGPDDRPTNREAEVNRIGTGHLKLPLDANARKDLEGFLCAGGDTRKRDNGVCSDNDAPRRYKALLELLGRQDPITQDDFLKKPTFKGFFHGNVVFGVVDARLPSTPLFPPLAVSDRRYWWVFYTSDGSVFDRFTVFLAPLPPRQARGSF